jgi:hypothetical protein
LDRANGVKTVATNEDCLGIVWDVRTHPLV